MLPLMILAAIAIVTCSGCFLWYLWEMHQTNLKIQEYFSSIREHHTYVYDNHAWVEVIDDRDKKA